MISTYSSTSLLPLPSLLVHLVRTHTSSPLHICMYLILSLYFIVNHIRLYMLRCYIITLSQKLHYYKFVTTLLQVCYHPITCLLPHYYMFVITLLLLSIIYVCICYTVTLSHCCNYYTVAILLSHYYMFVITLLVSVHYRRKAFCRSSICLFSNSLCIYECVCTHGCVCVCMGLCVCTGVCGCMYGCVCMYVWVFVYAWVCVYVWVFVYVCMGMCVCMGGMFVCVWLRVDVCGFVSLSIGLY
eukprot:GHVQ01006115.1.p1 GENE.GHVQ01006115.1~~GHVQ01006115.1.p1  ORF type:complete len:242 (+),score=10.41 GHVQ01006115.1:308-1033(+)